MLRDKSFSLYLISACLLCLVFSKGTALADVLSDSKSDQSRLAGFQEQVRKNKDFEKQRLSDVSEVKKNRQDWEKKREKDIAKYKQKKHEQSVDLNEKNAAYREDQREKKEQDQELEKARQAFIKKRDFQRSQIRKNIKITEEQEYGLNEKIVRSERSKRKVLAGPDGSPASSGGSSGSGFSQPAYTPPGDFGGSPDFEAPPAPPMNTGVPEFYEPESIPGIPPADSFDEAIPPPIFDEPEF